MSFQDFLADRRKSDRRQSETTSYADAMTVLYETRYTGPLTVHFAEGVPKTIEVPVAFRIGSAQN